MHSKPKKLKVKLEATKKTWHVKTGFVNNMVENHFINYKIKITLWKNKLVKTCFKTAASFFCSWNGQLFKLIQFDIENIFQLLSIIEIYIVNLKSNSALLYNKDHNLLTSAFPPKHVKLIKFPLKSWIFPY